MTLILGIDPGYDRLGVALVKKDGGKEELILSDCFLSSPKEALGERLLSVGNELEKLIKNYRFNY